VIAVGLVSLGCAKNQVDSEVMLGLLRRRGFEVTHRPERADVIVVNTCGFLEAARDEGYRTIREMARLKTAGRCRKLIVAGCLVQRRLGEMQSDLPEVDQFLSLNDVERIAEACDPGAPAFDADRRSAVYQPDDHSPRLLADPGPSAYLKISEGCDNPCAFCVIPQIRGRFRSRRPDSLVREARMLSEAGVREINIIAQDTTSYGSDLDYVAGLPGLLRELAEVDGIEWIRLLYAYPNRMTQELAELLGAGPILPYLDVPLQHTSREVLARMRRGGSRSGFTRMVSDLRRRSPDISLRTTFIVGFPGETEAEFEELRSFMEEICFDHVGLFTYSHEPGAVSAGFDDDVASELKVERLQILQDLQEGISLARYRSRIGSELRVLVEGRGEEQGTLAGRAGFQAPEVDGNVLFMPQSGGAGGDFEKVTIEEALPFSLLGPLPRRQVAAASEIRSEGARPAGAAEVTRRGLPVLDR